MESSGAEKVKSDVPTKRVVRKQENIFQYKHKMPACQQKFQAFSTKLAVEHSIYG